MSYGWEYTQEEEEHDTRLGLECEAAQCELYETDVSFERAVELILWLERHGRGRQFYSACTYGDGWLCDWGGRYSPIEEVRFGRYEAVQAPAQGRVYVERRPHGLPVRLRRNGTREYAKNTPAVLSQ
jgi:hypothetical protein